MDWASRSVRARARRADVARQELTARLGRTPDPTDRRQSLVSLTPHGREVLLQLRRRRSEWLAQRVAELDEHDKEVLRQAVGIFERICDK